VALWFKAPGQTAPGVTSKADESFPGSEPDYCGENHLGDLQVDVQLGWAGPVLSSRERVTRQLQQAEALLRNQPGNLNARFQQAIARFYRGADAQALEDLNGLIAKAPKVADAYQYRALVRARLGQAAEARADLAQYQRLSTNPRGKAYLDARDERSTAQGRGIRRGTWAVQVPARAAPPRRWAAPDATVVRPAWMPRPWAVRSVPGAKSRPASGVRPLPVPPSGPQKGAKGTRKPR
jgi:hypothetical protein